MKKAMLKNKSIKKEQNTKMICISENQATIIGTILSFVFGVIASYAGASFMIDTKLVNGDVSIYTICTILLPIIIIIFELYVLVFTAIGIHQSKNKS